MASQFWLDVASGLAQSYGMSGEQMLVIIAFLVSVGVACFFALEMRRHSPDHYKDVGVFAFFITLGIFALLGVISWLYIIVPLIIMGAFYFYTHKEGSS